MCVSAVYSTDNCTMIIKKLFFPLLDLRPCEKNPCQNGAVCMDKNHGNYSCQCTSGYIGQNCTEDIDECASNPCQNGGTCTVRYHHSYNCIH